MDILTCPATAAEYQQDSTKRILTHEKEYKYKLQR